VEGYFVYFKVQSPCDSCLEFKKFAVVENLQKWLRESVVLEEPSSEEDDDSSFILLKDVVVVRGVECSVSPKEVKVVTEYEVS